jgi:hypothetical protein
MCLEETVEEKSKIERIGYSEPVQAIQGKYRE